MGPQCSLGKEATHTERRVDAATRRDHARERVRVGEARRVGAG